MKEKWRNSKDFWGILTGGIVRNFEDFYGISKAFKEFEGIVEIWKEIQGQKFCAKDEIFVLRTKFWNFKELFKEF